MDKRLKRYLTKGDIQMANKLMKRYSTLYVSGEMKIKTIRSQYMPTIINSCLHM